MSEDGDKSNTLDLHEKHFPGRAPVEVYGNGGFRFADMSHKGSIICLSEAIYSWDVKAASDLVAEHFDRVLNDSDIEVFLLGLGPDFMPMPRHLKELFQGSGITVDPMSTGAAIRTYNVMLLENRAVGCGLIAVD